MQSDSRAVTIPVSVKLATVRGIRMMKQAGVVAALFLLVSSFAVAQPPAGKGKPDKGGGEDPPATFVPEILYRIDHPKNDELRFGNLEGDQAVLIHRGSSLGEVFDASTNSISTPQPNMIAYTTGNVVQLVEWSNANGFTLGTPQALLGAPDRVCGLAFSNADDRIAVDHCGAGLSVYTIPSDDIAGGSWTQVIGNDFNVIIPRWSPDDTSVYFYGGPYVAEQWVTGLYRYDFDNDQLALVLERTNDHSLYLDVAKNTNGETQIVTSLGGSMQFYDTSGAPVPATNPPEGDNFRFNCDASAVIHSQWGDRGNMLVISDLSGGSRVYADRKVRPISSWMTPSPCS